MRAFSTAYTDQSGTITSGGTAQTCMAANVARQGVIIQNVSAGDLYISASGTAAATVSANSGSLKLTSGSYWEAPINGVPRTAISIFGATTGQAFVAWEW